MPVPLEVMGHCILSLLNAFLVQPQPNMAVVDLNGKDSCMAY